MHFWQAMGALSMISGGLQIAPLDQARQRRRVPEQQEQQEVAWQVLVLLVVLRYGLHHMHLHL